MTTTTETQPTAWCPTCRRRQPIMDTYDTDTGDRLRAFVTYVAQPLECGHDAGDGGGTPFAPVSQPSADLVARLVALQEGARAAMVAEFAPAFDAPAPF